MILKKSIYIDYLWTKFTFFVSSSSWELKRDDKNESNPQMDYRKLLKFTPFNFTFLKLVME